MAERPSASLVVHEYGDAAVLVEVAAASYDERWRVAQALGRRLRDQAPAGLVDVVASFEHVLVAFDPLAADHADIRAAVLALAGAPAEPTATRHFVVPTVYGGEHGPDLDPLAARLGLTPDALVALHTSATWTVRFVGSPLGAPLSDGPRLPRPVPRLATPRTRVAPGTVALSGHQCIIYNAASPGGWQAIGRSPARMFDIDHPPHVPYRAGDTFSFTAVPAEEWVRWTGPLAPTSDAAAAASARHAS